LKALHYRTKKKSKKKTMPNPYTTKDAFLIYLATSTSSFFDLDLAIKMIFLNDEMNETQLLK